MIKNYRVSAALLTAALVINSCAVFAFADDEVTESGGTVVEEAVSETTEATEETPDEATDKAPADAPEETPAESTAETTVAEPANTDADDVLAIAGGKVRTFDSAESDSNANVGYGTAGAMGGTGPFSGRRGFHIFGKSNGSLKRVTDQYGFLSFIGTSKTPLAFRNSYSGSGL
ncbi:MAG: hypothetical protein IKH76_04865, partial [Clostridiales bacterium]|nr:hypothetical protein [Clostridiales bacterium]